MKKITVNIASSEKAYDILIGENLIGSINKIIETSSFSQIAIITDKNLKDYAEKIVSAFGQKPKVIIINPGESSKNIESVKTIWTELLANKFDRKSLIINLGGGVITDMGSFAASTYMRGIEFVNVPTTLLSQVDASIGGKTGIDFSGIKNLIGTFAQPYKVIIDVDTLKSLPDRDFNAGFSEIIKHGLIHDKKYYEFVTSKKPKSFTNSELAEIISKSCVIKKNVVEQDAKENGLRKILNFGHTIGHAIESVSLNTTSPLLHGEAISLGIVAEAEISHILNYISSEEVENIVKALTNADLPTKTSLNPEEILRIMKTDKKNIKNIPNFTLLKNIGKAIINQEPKEDTIMTALKYIAK